MFNAQCLGNRYQNPPARSVELRPMPIEGAQRRERHQGVGILGIESQSPLLAAAWPLASICTRADELLLSDCC